MRQLLLLLFCAFVPLLSMAQEGWQGEWQGDLQSFHIDGTTLAHRNDGVAGSASLFRSYQLGSSFSWHFGFQFIDLPTSNNTFEYTSMYVEEGGYRYYYKVQPEPNYRGIQLVQETYQSIAGSWRKLSVQVLSRQLFSSALLVWNNLQVELYYDQTRGLQIQSFSPLTGFWQGDWAEVRQGKITPRFTINTKFSSQKKLGYTYLLPEFTSSAEEPGEVKIVRFEPEDIGRVTLFLSAPVVAKNAVVACDGFHPTVMPGATANQLVVHLGVAFAPHSVYDFTISGLQDRSGRIFSLSFVVETKGESSGSTAIPKGVYFTEVMASPPNDGPLQAVKYIELYNNSGAPQQLGHFHLLYGSTKYQLPMAALAHGSFAILYLESDPYPTRLATLVPMERFPALSSSFALSLVGANGEVWDKINFSTRLYGEGEQKGGASVERVTYNPDSWRRSNHPNGGTPGAHTTLLPYKVVERGAVVINELLLSPSSTGEKYIELYNNSSQPINLADLYLTYSNKEESPFSTSWLLVRDEYLLQPQHYVALSSFPEALTRLYPQSDPKTFVERIDFPAISSTYSEIALHAHATSQTIDEVVYRRQWLGESSSDRTGYSLERISPTTDGTQRISWRRAMENGAQKGTGGTPGIKNSADGLPLPDHSAHHPLEWPADPILSYQQIDPMLQSFASLATLSLYSLTGDLLMSVDGAEIQPLLQMLKMGTAPLPTMLLLVDLHFHDPAKEPATVSYRHTWVHIR